jgi:hypothetical protein
VLDNYTENLRLNEPPGGKNGTAAEPFITNLSQSGKNALDFSRRKTGKKVDTV